MTGSVLLASSIHWGQWKFTGGFAALDLIAATTNALNGALLARRPDHYRGFTVVGVILMAFLGGVGGGITRDVLLNKIPAALLNPAYILLCLLAGIVGYRVAFKQGQLFREGLFQLMTSFSLPWYAIVGAQAGELAHLPVLGVLLLAVVSPTAGRYYIDVTCGVPPKLFIRGEWFVATALLTGVVWVICHAAGLNTWWSAGISFVIGFALRVAALYLGWEEPLAKEPHGVYQHPHGRPLLGRKIAGKSHRELKDLGLTVDKPAPGHRRLGRRDHDRPQPRRARRPQHGPDPVPGGEPRDLPSQRPDGRGQSTPGRATPPGRT